MEAATKFDYKSILVVLLVALAVALGGAFANIATEDMGIIGGADGPTAIVVVAMPPVENLDSWHYVRMEVANYGTIDLVLYGDVAPTTVNNFLTLVDEGFYDGLTFHRIIDGFMIQGGDPLGNGMGGSENKIYGEFSANGVENDLLHLRGTISMARSSDPNSASSQFFIMHQDAPHLDGSYAAFGQVISGLEVVDAICAGTPVEDWNGTVAPENQPVITSIRRIEKPE